MCVQSARSNQQNLDLKSVGDISKQKMTVFFLYSKTLYNEWKNQYSFSD